MKAVIGIIVGVGGLIFLVVALVFYVAFAPMGLIKSLIEKTFGGNDSSQSVTLETTDCSGGGGINVPVQYLPAIKQYAKIYMKGDEAALIALISVESPGFKADAISPTGPVGLGQFTYRTAAITIQQGAGLFKHTEIIPVPKAGSEVTEAEKTFFRTTYRFREGRLQPVPSIEATAYYFGNALKKYNGDIRTAYAEGYNRSTAIRPSYGGLMEKDFAANKVVEAYKKIKDGKGCKETKLPPGQLGEQLRASTAPKPN